jgi:hypothetical protein
MIPGLGIKYLMSIQDPEWVAEKIPLFTEDIDAKEIDKALISGMSPDEAAHHLHSHGTPLRRLEGLKYLARVRELLLMEVLGDSLETLVDKVKEGRRVMVHPRRMQQVVHSLKKDGIECEVVYQIRRID